MKMVEADVIWTPGAGVRVERRGSGWQRTPGDMWMHATSLGAYGQVETKGDKTKQALAMFILFNTIVVRDRVAAEDAHQAFLKIYEYRQMISPDMIGAADA